MKRWKKTDICSIWKSTGKKLPAPASLIWLMVKLRRVHVGLAASFSQQKHHLRPLAVDMTTGRSCQAHNTTKRWRWPPCERSFRSLKESENSKLPDTTQQQQQQPRETEPCAIAQGWVASEYFPQRQKTGKWNLIFLLSDAAEERIHTDPDGYKVLRNGRTAPLWFSTSAWQIQLC